MPRWVTLLLVLLLGLVFASAAGVWFVARPPVGLYVVAGATDVRVHDLGMGTRYITYDAPGGRYDWYFTVAEQLEDSGWIPPDMWGPAAQINIYTHVSSIWGGYGGYIWDQAELHGEPGQARITVRRWFRFPWRQYLGYFR